MFKSYRLTVCGSESEEAAPDMRYAYSSYSNCRAPRRRHFLGQRAEIMHAHISQAYIYSITCLCPQPLLLLKFPRDLTKFQRAPPQQLGALDLFLLRWSGSLAQIIQGLSDREDKKDQRYTFCVGFSPISKPCELRWRASQKVHMHS